MKKIIYSVFMATVFFVSCEEKETILESQIINQEVEKIVIDGVTYDFTFEQNTLGEISLKEEDDKNSILINFIEDNDSTCSYDDEKAGLVYLFKNIEEFKLFLIEQDMDLINNSESKNNNFELIENSDKLVSRKVSKLSLYRRINYVNLMWEYNLWDSGTTSINIPDFRNVFFGVVGNNYNLDNDLSSVKLESYSFPIILGPRRSTVIFYQEINYTGHTFAMSVLTGRSQNPNEIGETSSYSNLHRKKMYRRWFRTVYWGDRVSSMKYWSYPI